MKRALISVSDKTGIIEFTKSLIEIGYEIISTGGTKKVLEESGLKVIGISEITNFPEILNGRVKTLHPNVHGALLNVRTNKEHIKEIGENNIENIDIVVVNLYPFKETISKENVSYSDAIENIDIGGPSMIRSAAKNHKFVTVVCDNVDYDLVINEISEFGDTTENTRCNLAAKAFRKTASYDATISQYLTKEVKEENPESVSFTFDLVDKLRYGENPHQKASFYKKNNQPFSLGSSEQIQGKKLSYNNIQDSNAALQITREFKIPVVVALKHMNPCGVGVGENILEAWDRAYKSDSTSIFGGIIATNQNITEEVALKMSNIFLEVIIAPSFSVEALTIFKNKKNLRIIKVNMDLFDEKEYELKSVNGGLLVQELDKPLPFEYKNITKLKPDQNELNEMEFAWKIVKHVKSNAIVITKNGMTVGIGAGQMNRIGAAKIALEWARNNNFNEGLTLASDAFFPFDDVVKLAKDYGVSCIVQPGGSIKDNDSIKACNELGIKMIFTGIRHFKH